MERCVIEGESPVFEMLLIASYTLSTAGHEESCGNPGGPSPKAKYYHMTDSEQVP